MYNSYPSINLLPMDDIKAMLSFQPFSAYDTFRVDGVDAKNIAVCQINEDGISDRNTVLNALKLNNIDANNFLTLTHKEILDTNILNMINNYREEIISIKDEMYQMKTSLAKQGFIDDTVSYYGFSDFFKTNNIKYNKDKIIVSSISSAIVNGEREDTIYINPTDTIGLSINDYLLIGSIVDDEDLNCIIKINSIDYDSGVIKTKMSQNLGTENIYIKKIKGTYSDNKFSFSQLKNNNFTNKIKTTMLNDDENLHQNFITLPRSGYGVRFRVPGGIGGALDGFTVKLKHSGNPGPLKCVVYREDALNTIHNYVEAKELGYVVAESDIVQATEETKQGCNVKFNFSNKELIEEGTKYIFTILSAGTDSSYNEFGDEWAIYFSYHRSSSGSVEDLNKNNDSYKYVETSSLGHNSLAFSLINDYDMYFILSVNEIAEGKTEAPYKEGLYTSNINYIKNIDLNTYDLLTRLTLRISKEGLYQVTSNSSVYDQNNFFKIESKYPHINTNAINSFYRGDTVIINNNIRKIEGINSEFESFSIDKPLFVNKYDSIYKVAYKPYIRIKAKINNEIKYVSKELDLISILPYNVKQDEKVSDRLIFESLVSIEDFNVQDINSIEILECQLQIKWDSNINFAILPFETAKLHSGNIHDLSLCFETI